MWNEVAMTQLTQSCKLESKQLAFFFQSLVLYLDVRTLTTQNGAQIIFYGQFHCDMKAGLSNEEDITGPTLYV